MSPNAGAHAMSAEGNSVRQSQNDAAWVRRTLTGAAVLVIGALVVVPLVSVFAQALSEGVSVYWNNLFNDHDTLAAIKLTMVVAPTALALNLVFGVTAAWAIAKFSFPGRTLLTSLIDLPFSVSPVVAGLIFVLIFGLQGYLGPFLRRDGYSAMPYLLSLLAVAVYVLLYLGLRPINPVERSGWWDHPWL